LVTFSDPVQATPRHDQVMADFLAVVGTIVFVMVMLGLIWGFERV
jgi:hypothetical protein